MEAMTEPGTCIAQQDVQASLAEDTEIASGLTKTTVCACGARINWKNDSKTGGVKPVFSDRRKKCQHREDKPGPVNEDRIAIPDDSRPDAPMTEPAFGAEPVRLHDPAPASAATNASSAQASSTGGGTSYVESASDARTVNNTMRGEYRVLTDQEKLSMRAIKSAGESTMAVLDALEGHTGQCREVDIARIKLEEAIMWAVKGLTATR